MKSTFSMTGVALALLLALPSFAEAPKNGKLPQFFERDSTLPPAPQPIRNGPTPPSQTTQNVQNAPDVPDAPPVQPAVVPLKMMDFFSVDKNPGTGMLTYKLGKKTETISFGAESGLYGVGMVFNGSALPASFKKEFQRKRIIQLAFGNLRSGQTQVPQFAAVTLISSRIPTDAMSFKFSVPSAKEKNLLATALLLFTSPSTLLNQNDEDKLKGTYFAQGGMIILTPKDEPRRIEIRSQGKSYTFRWQMMATEIGAALVTPFNATESSLRGTIQIPIYWPSGDDAERLASRIATESLGNAELGQDDGIHTHKRDVAGSTPKDSDD